MRRSRRPIIRFVIIFILVNIRKVIGALLVFWVLIPLAK